VSERAAWYLVVGSHNQNYRSMALDGEVLMAVSGPRALAGLADFYLILGLSTWLDTPEELEEYLPAAGNFFRRLSRWAQIVS
jgi:phosphatidylserine/phosphatidylglycerophosphate/cardiolipin synthase-like enzyme